MSHVDIMIKETQERIKELQGVVDTVLSQMEIMRRNIDHNVKRISDREAEIAQLQHQYNRHNHYWNDGSGRITQGPRDEFKIL